MTDAATFTVWLQLDQLDDDVAVFAGRVDGPERLTVQRPIWEQMGRPAELTIELRPGSPLDGAA